MNRTAKVTAMLGQKRISVRQCIAVLSAVGLVALYAPWLFAQPPLPGNPSAPGGPPDLDAPPSPLKGDLHLQYFFLSAQETMPYRLYVPTSWDGKAKLPLIVLLHGGGLDENAAFTAAQGELQNQAERRGYVILAPFGYRKLGMYGSSFPLPKTQHATLPPSANETRKLSEEDVLNTIAMTEQQYPIDKRRVFLMGNSMGSVGAIHLVMEFPARWAAIAISDGPPDPDVIDYEKFKATPVRDAHGDRDAMAPLASSEEIVARLKAHWAQSELIVVKDGTHTNSWVTELEGTFDFFDRQSAVKTAR